MWGIKKKNKRSNLEMEKININKDRLCRLWLDSNVKNVNLYGYTDKELRWIEDRYKNRGIKYINSNRYQVDKLVDKLINFSKVNYQTYDEYKYDIEEKEDEIVDNDDTLFDNYMIDNFIRFCYENSKDV